MNALIRHIRGAAALVVGVLLTFLIVLVSLSVGLLYRLTIIGPMVTRRYNLPHPLLFFSRLQNAAIWHVCYSWILGMHYVDVDMTKRLEPWRKHPFEDERPTLHITLATHPPMATLFPFCNAEMSRWFNTVFTVKWEQIYNPFGWAAFLCGAFVFIKRGEKGAKRDATIQHLRESVERAIHSGVRLILFGDGSRFSPQKLEALRRSKKKWLAQRAQELHAVLPERYKGLQAILEQAEAIGADARIRVCSVLTPEHGTEHFLRLHRLVGKPVYVFHGEIAITASSTQAEMRELWNYLDKVARNPAKAALKLRNTQKPHLRLVRGSNRLKSAYE